jgi:hypothetical protein
MKLSTLRFADFSSLSQAITDWHDMVGKLRTLSDDANQQLKGKADRANWQGVNATVTREFITKTSQEFTDAHSEAQSIYNILNDTKTELEGYKQSLNDRIDRGIREHNLTVIDSGDSFTVTMNVHPDRSTNPDSLPESTEADVTALRDDISSILERATTSDSSAADALRSIVQATQHGFANVSYSDRDSAATALSEAERLADLAAQDPGELSPEEFDELNEGLGRYNSDDLFAERFATTLGPEGTLRFWSTVNDSFLSDELLRERGEDQYAELQENLSLTMANATQSDSEAMQSWEEEMVGLGDEFIETDHNGHRGFTIISSLMRHGDYDDQFLTDYGNKLIEFEKEQTGATDEADLLYWDNPGFGRLNYTGTDNGLDPMTGYMEALGRSPEAATTFFNTDYGDLKSDDPEKTLSNFEYLFEERNWATDYDSEGEESDQGHNAMAWALEAATTGRPFDEHPTLENIPHTQEQADLYAAVVGSVSEDPERLTDHSNMSDSFGQMSAEYMPDIHRALDPSQDSADELYPVSGAAAELSERDATRFMYHVGRNPEGYAALNIGQHNYTANLMQYHMEHPDAVISSPGDRANQEALIGRISERAGEIQGTIAAGRAYEVETDGGADDAAFNDALNGAGDFASGLVGVGAGLATAPFTGPGAIVAGGVATTGADAIINAIIGGAEHDNSEPTIYRNGEEWDGTKQSTYEMVERAAREAGTSTDSPFTDALAILASDSAEEGFDHAGQNVHDYLDGEGIPHTLDTD